MGFFQQQQQQPNLINPDSINFKAPITQLPSVNTSGSNSGITYDPVNGVNVRIDGIDNIKQTSNQSQKKLQSIIPDLDRITDRDMEFASAYADLLYNKGKRNVEADLSNNISKFREDAFNRGMANSSSFLNGINSLFGSNSGALANLQSDSMLQGMKYAFEQAQMRNQAANILNSINNDTYRQINEIPLNIGSNFAVQQGNLAQDGINNYNKAQSDAIKNYNDALNRKYQTYMENQDTFLNNFLISNLQKPKYMI